MFFDWYQATVQASPDEILEAIMASKIVHSFEPQPRGGHGYKQSMRFADAAGDSHLVLWHGSSTAAPSIQASSVMAEPMSKLIRSTWPQHSVSRADVSQDFSKPGGYRKTCRTIKSIAAAKGVTSGYRRIPYEAEKGMTQYTGSEQSAAMCRCYEKGKELLRKKLVTLEEFDPNHYRVEFQLRPNKSQEKQLFATLDPGSMLGYSPWVREAALKVFNFDAPVIERVSHQPAEIDLAFEHALFQSRKTYRRKVEAHNNRHIGLADMDVDEELDLLWELARPRLRDLWMRDDENEPAPYRKPEERGRNILAPPSHDPNEEEGAS